MAVKRIGCWPIWNRAITVIAEYQPNLPALRRCFHRRDLLVVALLHPITRWPDHLIASNHLILFWCYSLRFYGHSKSSFYFSTA